MAKLQDTAIIGKEKFPIEINPLEERDMDYNKSTIEELNNAIGILENKNNEIKQIYSIIEKDTSKTAEEKIKAFAKNKRLQERVNENKKKIKTMLSVKSAITNRIKKLTNAVNKIESLGIEKDKIESIKNNVEKYKAPYSNLDQNSLLLLEQSLDAIKTNLERDKVLSEMYKEWNTLRLKILTLSNRTYPGADELKQSINQSQNEGKYSVENPPPKYLIEDFKTRLSIVQSGKTSQAQEAKKEKLELEKSNKEEFEKQWNATSPIQKLSTLAERTKLPYPVTETQTGIIDSLNISPFSKRILNSMVGDRDRAGQLVDSANRLKNIEELISEANIKDEKVKNSLENWMYRNYEERQKILDDFIKAGGERDKNQVDKVILVGDAAQLDIALEEIRNKAKTTADFRKLRNLQIQRDKQVKESLKKVEEIKSKETEEKQIEQRQQDKEQTEQREFKAMNREELLKSLESVKNLINDNDYNELFRLAGLGDVAGFNKKLNEDKDTLRQAKEKLAIETGVAPDVEEKKQPEPAIEAPVQEQEQTAIADVEEKKQPEPAIEAPVQEQEQTAIELAQSIKDAQDSLSEEKRKLEIDESVDITRQMLADKEISEDEINRILGVQNNLKNLIDRYSQMRTQTLVANDFSIMKTIGLFIFADTEATKYIKKVDGFWRVISGETGKLWPQKYKTAKDAKAALRAYWFNKSQKK